MSGSTWYSMASLRSLTLSHLTLSHLTLSHLTPKLLSWARIDGDARIDMRAGGNMSLVTYLACWLLHIQLLGTYYCQVILRLGFLCGVASVLMFQLPSGQPEQVQAVAASITALHRYPRGKLAMSSTPSRTGWMRMWKLT